MRPFKVSILKDGDRVRFFEDGMLGTVHRDWRSAMLEIHWDDGKQMSIDIHSREQCEWVDSNVDIIEDDF